MGCSESFLGMHSRTLVLVVLPVILAAILSVQAELTDEDVLEAVQDVFPPSDGSTLVGQGAAGIQHILPVLQRIATTGCPSFTTSAAWPHDLPLLKACVWAVMGRLANDEVTNGGAFMAFSLDTSTGTIVRGMQDESMVQSTMILSSLIVVLLLAVGCLMFMQSSPVTNYKSS